MPKYDYCEVYVERATLFREASAVGVVFNETGVYDVFQGRVGVLFAQLGNLGWKLVSSVAAYNTAVHYFIYEKPEEGLSENQSEKAGEWAWSPPPPLIK